MLVYNNKAMDAFIKNIYFILDIIKRKPNKKELIEHNIIEKQYLAYYLYRILCKYEKMIENNISSRQKINDIYTILRIPLNYQGTCYPMAHKMTHNEQLLDVVILGILDIIKEVDTNLKESIGNRQYEEFIEFVNEKTIEEILINIQVLQRIFPNLGVTGVKPFLYEYIEQQNQLTAQQPINNIQNNVSVTDSPPPEQQNNVIFTNMNNEVEK
jgi:hypothetical protein